MHLESPATYESNQQRFKRELDSEAWSTHTGKGQTSCQLSLYLLNLSHHFSPLDIPCKEGHNINLDPHDGGHAIRLLV